MITSTPSLDQVKAAIERLPLREQFQLLDWLDQHANEGWDRQIAEDAASGKLDKALKQVDEDAKSGRLRAWP